MTRTWLLVAMLLLSSHAMAFEWRELWQRKDQQAHKLLESGDPQTAAELFDDSRWRGISQYQAGNYEQAQAEFAANEDITSLYNRGVSEVRGGQYQQAIESFEQVLAQDAQHEDAQHNLVIAKALADQQQNQEQQQDQQQQQDSEDQNDEDQKNDSNNNEEQNNPQENQQQSEDDNQSQSDEAQSQQDESQAAEQNESQSEKNQTGSEEQGDLSEQPAESSEQQSADEQAQQALREQLQQQFEAGDEAEPDEAAEQPVAVPAAETLSEDQQATEQWLRLIPDDPSQLLRNKIKLNHMLEHAQVRDTKEPW